MSTDHRGGNILPAIGLEEHDGSKNAKRVVIVGTGSSTSLIPLSLTLSSSSIVTLAIPTNTFKITSILISSDATVRVSIKSGPSYLTGNASLGVSLNPGGGWVETGSSDAPVYVGLIGAASLVIEKFDMTSTKANVGGKIIYFDE